MAKQARNFSDALPVSVRRTHQNFQQKSPRNTEPTQSHRTKRNREFRPSPEESPQTIYHQSEQASVRPRPDERPSNTTDDHQKHPRTRSEIS